MKLFKCTNCGQLLYFENQQCESCGHALGFLPEQQSLVTLTSAGDSGYHIVGGDTRAFHYCANNQYGVCNWLVPAEDAVQHCVACRLNRTIPDLDVQDFFSRWRQLEAAKHRLVYTLLRLKMPLVSQAEDPEKGLAFDFLANPADPDAPRVLTGHDDGLITINIEEGDDIEREMARRAMDEAYRTVLGHFRHEVGHYYWDRLIADTGRQDDSRRLFGDERQDYGEALEAHYANGAPADWQARYISEYAAAHPWEDWAETWAHYLHIMDTLETAYAFGLSVSPILTDETDEGLDADMDRDPFLLIRFDSLIDRWLPLTFAMNSLNRSMGHRDLYPFVIPPRVIDKLVFVHDVCREVRRAALTAR